MTEKTLRDEFAMAALQGMLANSFSTITESNDVTTEIKYLVVSSYHIAAKMMEARKEHGE